MSIVPEQPVPPVKQPQKSSFQLVPDNIDRAGLAAIFATLALGLAGVGGLLLATKSPGISSFAVGLLFLTMSVPVFWMALALHRAPNEYFAPVMLPEAALTWWHRLATGAGVLAIFVLEEINANLFGLRAYLPPQPAAQLALLIGGVLLMAWGCSGGWNFSLSGRRIRTWRDLNQEQRLEIGGVLILTLLALLLRAVSLERTIPGIIDEVSFTSLFPWFDHQNVHLLEPLNTVAAFPRLYVYFQWLTAQVIGRDLNALRLISAVLGALTVPALYWLGKHLFDRRVGAAAALLLATYPVHLQLSRVGLNNVGDPLFGVLTFALIARGLRYGGRANFALAGVTLGFTQYFHEAGRLTFPIITGLWLVWILIRTRNPILLRRVLMLAGIALVMAIPVYLTLNAMQVPFTARIADVGLRADYWQSLTGIGQLMSDIFTRTGNALQHLIYSPERVLYYAGNTPYLLPFLTPFITIGLAYALWRWSRPATLLLLLWLLIPFSGIVVWLAEMMSARTTVFIPALMLIAGIGIVYGLRAALETPLEQRPTARRGLAVLIVVVVCLTQSVYYFGDHLPAFIRQMDTVQPWQQLIFLTRDFPIGSQLHLITDRPTDQRYMNEVVHFMANDARINVYPHLKSDITAELLQTITPDAPLVFALQMPDTTIDDLLHSAYPDAVLLAETQSPDVSPWFRIYLVAPG